MRKATEEGTKARSICLERASDAHHSCNIRAGCCMDQGDGEIGRCHPGSGFDAIQIKNLIGAPLIFRASLLFGYKCTIYIALAESEKNPPCRKSREETLVLFNEFERYVGLIHADLSRITLNYGGGRGSSYNSIYDSKGSFMPIFLSDLCGSCQLSQIGLAWFLRFSSFSI